MPGNFWNAESNVMILEIFRCSITAICTPIKYIGIFESTNIMLRNTPDIQFQPAGFSRLLPLCFTERMSYPLGYRYVFSRRYLLNLGVFRLIDEHL